MSDFDDRGMDRWTDDRLLREANRGDTRAFTVFCVRSLPSLRRYVRFQCGSLRVPIDQVDDFCHDAIVKAVEHINSCKVQGDKPLPRASVAWLKRIAFNSIRDWRRKNQRVILVDQVESEFQSRLSADALEEYEEILKFFQWLSAEQHDMLELVLVEGLSIQAAGEKLGLSKANAYKVYERGLGMLRDLLEEHGSRTPIAASNRVPYKTR